MEEVSYIPKKIHSTTSNPSTPIPDNNFRNALLSCINTNGTTTLSGQTNVVNFGCTESFEGMITTTGNRISNDALRSITKFNYGIYPVNTDKPDKLKISSLSGVEQMVNLTKLNVHNNSLSGGLSLAANTALISLFVNENSLSSLNVSSNTALTSLFVNDNPLSSLNVSTNTALTHLSAGINSLSSLDISTNTELTHLSVGINSLSSLDVSNNTALRTLNVISNTNLRCIRADASQLSGGSNIINFTTNMTITLSVNCP